MDRLTWISALDGEWADASVPRRTRLWVVGGLAVVVTVAILTRPPIPQIQSYNDFIDQRAMLGVPNLLNTLSNVPFLLVGVLGLFFVWRNQASDGGGPFASGCGGGLDAGPTTDQWGRTTVAGTRSVG
jgi:hypothetical protein